MIKKKHIYFVSFYWENESDKGIGRTAMICKGKINFKNYEDTLENAEERIMCEHSLKKVIIQNIVLIK